MSKLKPGGLAIIISSLNPENIGKVVETVFYDGMRPSPVTFERAETWFVKAINGQLVTVFGHAVAEGRIAASRLLPINDDPDQFTDELESDRVLEGAQ